MPSADSATAPKGGEAKAFPIVGVGASAGGLEALEQFFSHVPPDSGMAYVVIQHLDPTRKDVMSELLQRTAKIPVMPAADQMAMQPDHVYVIPPNKFLALMNRSLYLVDPDQPRGLCLPVDYFFRALADEQRERAIGVILSGMGSDGTLGLRAIKENAGLALVQEPASAKFDGMPMSAIDAGLADIIAPAGELPEKIFAYVGGGFHEGQHVAATHETGARKSALDKVFALLRAHTGHDFSLYKKSTIYRRIERRMGIHQLGRINDYVHFLNENPQEVGLLFKELLIGVT